MIRKSMFAWLFMFLAISVKSQVLTIKDKVTHQPLELVTVYSKNPEASTFTDAKGRADIGAFGGADSIYIRLMGYKQVVHSFRQLEKAKFYLLLEQSEVSLDELVISATRWEQKKREAPNKITTITPSEITLQNPQTAADLLQASDEVFIQKSQLGGGSPMIRGFSSNRVLLSVDGVRMNTAIFRSGNLQNVIALDPLAIEKTEVVFGPGSVIYGSDAIGGVMSFYTLKPKFSSNEKPLVKGAALTRYSSANFEKTAHFDLNTGFKKWAFLTSASLSTYDHLKMGSHGPDEYLRNNYAVVANGKDTILANPDPEMQVPTAFSQLNLMQKVRYKPGAAWNIDYGFHYSVSTDIPRYDRLIETKDDRLKKAVWYYGPQLWMMNALNVQHAGNNKWYDNAQATLAYQKFEESRHDRSFGKIQLRHRTETVNAISANVDFEKTLNKKNTLFYGVETIHNHVGSVAESENIETGKAIPVGTRYPDGSTWQSHAVYLNYLLKAGKKLTFQSGLRYNRIMLESNFDTTFFPFPFTHAKLNTGALTGSAGLAYSPITTLQLNLNFSTGYKAPNIDDMGKVFDSEPGTVIVPNPNLKPEYAYNAEAGIVKTFAGSVKLDITGYYTVLEKAMVRRPFTLNGKDSIMYDGTLSEVESLQNASMAYVWGIQTGMEIKLPEGIGVSSHFNYQKGEEMGNNGSFVPLRHVAPLFGSAHITYSRNRLKADLYSNYNGEISNKNLAPSEQKKTHIYASDGNNKPYSPGWHTLNFKFMYQVTDFLMASAGVENITHQRYRPYSSGITAPGRNFIGSLKASF